MSLLDTLFSGVKAFANELVSFVSEAIGRVLKEIDQSSFGRAATQFIRKATEKYFDEAADLAAEERELADKFIRDGRLSEADAQRARDIETERSQIKEEFETAKSQEAGEEFEKDQDSVIAAPLVDDEVSAAVGILASKVCPKCGGTMRIRQGGFDLKTERRNFYWKCNAGQFGCPTITLDPRKQHVSVMRKADPNLDLSLSERRKIWQRKDVVVETAGRLRQALGEEDKEMICPTHLLPMRLLPRNNSDGRLLTTYEYVCLAVNSEGRACQHRVPLETFPQVSEALRRRDGHGIIRN
jgi:hypothetical protein